MKYSIKLKNYHKWIFFLFPFLLISGPFFPDLIISCVSIFFLIKVVKNNEYYLLRNNIFYFLISFYLYLNINSLFSHQPYISFETSIPYIRFILFAFFLSYCLNLNFNLKEEDFYNLIYSNCYYCNTFPNDKHRNIKKDLNVDL
jgi:hypothetical protein